MVSLSVGDAIIFKGGMIQFHENWIGQDDQGVDF